MSLIKTTDEINIMRAGGKILGSILENIYQETKVGTDIWDLETSFIRQCRSYKVKPACKGFDSGGYMPPFPTGLCVSINNQSVHCFPKKGIKLQDGDLITVDTVIKYRSMHLDAAFAKCVGKVSPLNKKLVDTAKDAMYAAIFEIRPNVHLGKVSHAMQAVAEKNGFNVLTEYAGHGIGNEMHEYPDVPCYGREEEGPILKSGMTICIESLICEGRPEVVNINEWETRMRDGKKWLQFEHTVLVTDSGDEILTPFKV
jgi:methionyl aminopeptidase